MYSDHQPLIADYAAQSPSHFFSVGRFVLATVNRHFEDVPRVLRDLDRRGTASPFLTRQQRYAVACLETASQSLYERLVGRWLPAPDGAAHNVLRIFARLPGFGLVKAGFLTQLVMPDIGIGCLDRHNIRAYGLRASVFNTKPVKLTLANVSRVNQYIAVCKSLGGARILWDRWCEYMAALRAHIFPSAEAVSELHVACVVR